jgi:hypothetical protein
VEDEQLDLVDGLGAWAETLFPPRASAGAPVDFELGIS